MPRRPRDGTGRLRRPLPNGDQPCPHDDRTASPQVLSHALRFSPLAPSPAARAKGRKVVRAGTAAQSCMDYFTATASSCATSRRTYVTDRSASRLAAPATRGSHRARRAFRSAQRDCPAGTCSSLPGRRTSPVASPGAASRGLPTTTAATRTGHRVARVTRGAARTPAPRSPRHQISLSSST